jgi:hypothetical protein
MVEPCNKEIKLNDISDIQIIMFIEKVKEKFKNIKFKIMICDSLYVIEIKFINIDYFKIQYDFKNKLYQIGTRHNCFFRLFRFENNDDMFNVADMIYNAKYISELNNCNEFITDYNNTCTIIDNDDNLYFSNSNQYIKFNKKFIGKINSVRVLYNSEINIVS